MNTLFPEESIYPEGFSYTPNFISTTEEEQLVEEIKKLNLHTFLFQGYEAKRKVASFGQDWSFDKRTLSKGADIPKPFDFIIKKIAGYIGKDADDFAELLVTEYPVGSVINWHRDAPPFDLIAGISLLTDATFRLRPYDKAQQGRKSIVSITAERRSLYIMQDAARSEWEHSISPVKKMRYSITLRTLKNRL